MNPTMKRLLIWSLLGVVLALALALLLWPRAVPVDIAVVTRGPLIVSLAETGRTRVRDTFVLSAPVTGRLARIEAEPGEPVLRGDTVLAMIAPIEPALLDRRSLRQAQAAMDAAEDAAALAAAELAGTEADSEFATAELERARRLRTGNMISVRELDLAIHDQRAAQAAVETARAALAMSQHELERARAQLLLPGDVSIDADGAEDAAAGGEASGTTTGIAVRAPVDGTVLAVRRESAGLVAAGEPLIDIGDTRDLEIVVDLLSTDAVKVQPGQSVVIDEWGGTGELEGRVRRIEPLARTKVSALGIEEQRADAIIDLISPVEARPGLGHGYQLDVGIVLWEGEAVLTVPLTALLRVDDNWALYIARDGRATRREVTIGRRTDLEAEIVSGLEPGDRVVLHPSDRVGDSVRIVERGTL